MHRKCIPQTKLESKIKQTTVYHSAQVGLCITDETVAERMQRGGRMLGCKPRVHYPSTLPLLSFLVHPPSSFLLWSSLIFPLFAPPNSFRHSHLIWGRKCGFFFFSGFSGFFWWGLSHLMQCNEANTFSLFYLLATKTFVTNCVLCWTGTSSCGTEKRNGGVDMWTRIGEIKASTQKEKTRKSNDTSGDINHYRNCEVCPVSLCIFGSLNPIVIFHGAS